MFSSWFIRVTSCLYASGLSQFQFLSASLGEVGDEAHNKLDPDFAELFPELLVPPERFRRPGTNARACLFGDQACLLLFGNKAKDI